MFVYLLFLYVITIVICRALQGLNLEKKFIPFYSILNFDVSNTIVYKG